MLKSAVLGSRGDALSLIKTRACSPSGRGFAYVLGSVRSTLNPKLIIRLITFKKYGASAREGRFKKRPTIDLRKDKEFIDRMVKQNL